MTGISHHYSIDAATLLESCVTQLQHVVELDTKGSHAVLYELKEILLTTERLLLDFYETFLQEADTTDSDNVSQHQPSQVSPSETKEKSLLGILRSQKLAEQKQVPGQRKSSSSRHSHGRARQINTSISARPIRNDYSPSRSVTDTLLFRLIVALQLCLVRIDDAHFVIAGCRGKRDGEDLAATRRRQKRRKWLVNIGYCGGIMGATAFLLHRQRSERRTSRSDGYDPTVLETIAKVTVSAFLARMTARQWKALWMTSKLDKTIQEIRDWQEQWFLVHCTPGSKPGTSSKLSQHPLRDSSTDDAQSDRLIEYVKTHPYHSKQSSSFWISDGELRFMIVRKAMEAYYSLTSVDEDSKQSQQLPSYFRDLIQTSWGLVSRPAVKNFSLRASRLLKGASVADRIEIAGIPCFVISRHPCPELAAAIQLFKRKRGDGGRLSLQLSTIDEFEECEPSSLDTTIPKKLFAGSNDSYRQQDVILHCTGGGFFAHMIAFDLLYLLDWSESTGTVVICPEFSLLPDHPFPVALQEIINVYATLVSGDAVSTLGFEVNNIAVTGESTGANLAAALCVNLCLDAESNSNSAENHPETVKQEQPSSSSPKSTSDSEDEYLFPETISSASGSGSEDHGDSCRSADVRLPDALMLSCAVLNLSLELSHSRVIGNEDPVLPSGVMSAISDAYLPSTLGISKKHLLASPLYAPDSILAKFPSTLLFASSNDPLLDDSVVFNQRLRSLGVKSEIRAVSNMPHAYWGLGTAGFPEAKKVQSECRQWLAQQLERNIESAP